MRKAVIIFLLGFLSLTAAAQLLPGVIASAKGVSYNPLVEGLLLVLDLDETSGTTVYDGLGVNDGTTNATVNTAGFIGRCETFQPNNGIRVPNTSGLTFPASHDEFTVSLMFSTEGVSQAENRYLFYCRHTGSPSAAVYVNLNTSNKIDCAVYNSANTGLWFSGSYVFDSGDLNTWFHLVVTLRGAGTRPEIWLDGVSIASSWSGGNGSGYFTGDICQFADGVWVSNRDSGGWDGRIDCVYLWDRALSTDEIAELNELMNDGTPHPFY